MIPLIDLQKQYHSIQPDIDAAVRRVMETGSFILGKDVAAFETGFAAFCGVKNGVGVNSGTSALHLALLAAGVGPGDEVITVPFTFIATAAAILYTGAKPVFVDVDPDYFTMDPSHLEKAITPRTKAVIPVHLYGQMADMDPILDITRKRGIRVIEDAAQAHGAEYKGQRAGSFGDMGCFSFYPGKNLGACGEGGMVVTDNPEFVRTLRMLRDWGQEERYHFSLKGFNYRMEGIQGAVLGVKLGFLEQWTKSRRQHQRAYTELLSRHGVFIPQERKDTRHAVHVLTVFHDKREALRKFLADQGIQTGIHYPIPVHLQEAYRDLGYKEGDFPISERAAQRTLSLPLFPEMEASQIQEICRVVGEFINQ